jgi:hypothetical protein
LTASVPHCLGERQVLNVFGLAQSVLHHAFAQSVRGLEQRRIDVW